jgi:hypothetical protein
MFGALGTEASVNCVALFWQALVNVKSATGSMLMVMGTVTVSLHPFVLVMISWTVKAPALVKE